MILIYDYGIINLSKILDEIGNIEFNVANYEKVSRTLYPEINDNNCFKLLLRTKKKGVMGKSAVIFETSTMEDAEKMKNHILESFIEGVEKLSISSKKEIMDNNEKLTD